MVLAAACIGAVAAMSYSLLQEPLYRSSAILYVTSGSSTSSQSAYQGSLASQQRVASYAKLATSESVVSGAVDFLGGSLSPDYVADSVSASASEDTVLLTIRALDGDPDTAALLANSVANALVQSVRTLETPTAGGDPLAKVTVVTPAVASDDPVSPATLRNTVIGFVLGGLLGLLIVIVRNGLDTKIRSTSDVQALTSTPVLSSLPYDPILGEGPLDFGAGASSAAEAFRQLRVNLSFVSVDNPSRAIAVTSPNAGEGKSTIAVNLASAIAESGVRVVLVDADLRRPNVHRVLGLAGGAGFTDILTGRVLLDDVVQRSPKSGDLDVVSAGSAAPNPAELLGSRRAEEVFSRLRSEYEWVIVDAPPVLPVADTATVSNWLDGVLMVVRAGATERADVAVALGQLETAGVPVLGVVANALATTEVGYYGATYGPSDQSAVASSADLTDGSTVAK
ncbi:polysaccharide biosynthesis tyrosine autokinase [Gordonia sp. Z-3]|uniref:polysaccharide biosynthesis tyrosine autokinase n=1 Tax=Gordonia sp. Z-3 TaxID=3115408 RepID=UPI002E292F1E|nr:polysaccharide biosynthesis tyrosine autokinase [Gordonia sp. Z-3]MED5803092.1 polysaccharide biosynthesis tyrosine autokinase [Gordonia sp. Z-3]